MRHRHLVRATIGLVALGAAVCYQPSLPAAATTVSATVVAGTFEIYDSSGSLLVAIDPADTSTDCSAPVLTVTTNAGPPPGNSWTVTFISDQRITIGTVALRFTSTTSISGTWVNLGGVTFPLVFGYTMTTTFRRSVGAGQCALLTTAGPCTVAVSSGSGTGTMTAVDPANLATGDTLVMSGDNGPYGDLGFEVSVSGTAGDCGSLIGADDGAHAIANLELEID
jgi:hypothetical protein